MTKKSALNAELIIELLRFKAGFLVFCVGGFLLGWALSSQALGIVFVLWLLFLGPLTVFPLYLWIERTRGNLVRLDLAKHSQLCELYFSSLLQNPSGGVAPEIWLWKTDFSGFLYFEKFSFSSSQKLFLTQGWIELGPSERKRQWTLLWQGMGGVSRIHRLLKRMEMHYWMGVFFLLDFFALFLQFFFEILGFRDMPRSTFWFQLLGRAVHRFWFGRARQKDFLMSPRKNDQGNVIVFPKILASTLWGPWFSFYWKDFHPIYHLFESTESEQSLEVRATR